MVDISILEELGITNDRIRSVVNPESVKEGEKKALQKDIEKFEFQRNNLRDRIRRGVEENFKNFRLFQAIDLSLDTPLRQITPTILSSLMDKDPTKDGTVSDTLGSLGLSHLLTEVTDPKSQQKLKMLNLPVFYNIFVPLVKAYVTIRLAKIMNDRNQVPFFKYEPSYSTVEDTIKCEVITGCVEMMNRGMGYYEQLKKMVFNMLSYGRVLAFPEEEWYFEEQYSKNKPKDKVPAANLNPPMPDLSGISEIDPTPSLADKDTQATKKNEFYKVRVKEGLRWHVPHPTRVFYDKSHSLTTLNTDTGITYTGYWRIQTWKEIASKPGFWNLDRVSIGQTDWLRKGSAFFQNVYPCVLSWPEPADVSGSNDRETFLSRQFYTGSYADKSVLITEYFEKIIPKDWGFGDYDCPVWFRFVVASDDTVLYAAPIPFPGGIYAGYDADEAKDQNSSLALEVLPFQDHIGNLLTQYVVSAKNNLSNLTMIDEEILSTGDLEKLKGSNDKFYRQRNIATFSSAALRRKQVGPIQNALFDLPVKPINTQELIQGIKLLLEILERVLVMSSQEIAQAASHELKVEEVRNIAASTSSRMEYTATPVDTLMDTMKLHLYNGMMAYGDSNLYAEVEVDGLQVTKESLEKLGFTVEDDVYTDRQGNQKAKVQAKKTAVAEMTFASQRDANNRINDGQMASAIGQFMNQFMANPVLLQALGADQCIQIGNIIAKLAGFPRYFKLRNQGGTPEEQQAQAQQQLQQIVQVATKVSTQITGQAVTQLSQEIAQQVGGEMHKIEQVTDQLSKEAVISATSIQHLKDAVKILADHQDAHSPLQPPLTPPPNDPTIIGAPQPIPPGPPVQMG